MSLPPERVPFPVAPVFRIRPDMRRWSGDDRGPLRLDARYPDYLAEKLRLLEDDAAGCRVLAPGADPEGLRRALLHVAEVFAAETSREAAGAGTSRGAPVAVNARGLRLPLLGVTLDRNDLTLRPDGGWRAAPGDPDGGAAGAPGTSGGLDAAAVPANLRARVRAHLEGLAPLERLADALALAVQEDLVIMRGDGVDDGAGDGAGDRGGDRGGARGGDGRGAEPHHPAGHAELLHVCFPSSWDPAALAGADFGALHAPVPHGEVLERAAPNVVRAMVSKGPFVRYVWSVAPDGRLDRNPRRRADLRAHVPPEALWFRVERQTVMPMPELARALFTIRVYVAPLARVLTSGARRRTLAAAVASMDEALLAYKGVGGGRDALLGWLGAGEPTAS